MIVKTRGIVLNYIKFKDTSIIARVLTEDYGLQSFIVQGIRSAKSRKSIGHFQAFSLLELVAYWNPNKDLHRLSDFKSGATTHTLHLDVKKNTIILFLSEFLSKVLSIEQEENKPLFNWLWSSIIQFDLLSSHYENFHIYLLLKITPFLGFGIKTGEDLYASMEKLHLEDTELSTFFSDLVMRDHTTINASGSLRTEAIKILIDYYHAHLDHLGSIKSLTVLQQVFT
ncbi:MAG: DNA repair protein RecO [Cyclobacteriaceae bacterium]|nr:DNA repair protein RecO [Cyclobacteriaceae bacterium HetDA_MAG_MS6]